MRLGLLARVRSPKWSDGNLNYKFNGIFIVSSHRCIPCFGLRPLDHGQCGLISDHSLGEASCRFMRTFRLPSERVCKRLRPIYKHMKRTYQTPDDGNSSDNSTAISGETPPEPPS